MSHVHSPILKSWQFLFILLGSITCVWSMFVFWWMPDSPMRAHCFSETDRVLMIERVRANQTGIQNKRFKKAHVLEAIQDPQVWLYILIQIMYASMLVSSISLLTLVIPASKYQPAVSDLSRRS
jgi:hypothetical protein